MGKSTLPGLKGAGSTFGWNQDRHCIACKRRILWGPDRCQDCRDKLRQRKRRKPR